MLFNCGRIGASGAQKLATALKDNTKLSKLTLYNQHIGDAGVKALATALEHNRCLRELSLQDEQITATGIQALTASLLRKTGLGLTTLNLNYNNIGTAGAQALAIFLEHDDTLISLSLLRTGIDDAGLQTLSVALGRNRTLTTLDLSHNNEIDAVGVQALATMLGHNHTLTTLKLSIKNAASAQAISTALEHDSTLTTLGLSYNSADVAGIQALATGFERNSRLRNVTLVWNAGYGNSIDAIGIQALTTALECNGNITLTLRISSSSLINTTSIQALADMLGRNISLTELDMSLNKIKTAGAQVLAPALEHNTTLKTLNLSYNEIDDVGVQRLATMLLHNTTLTSLNLSQLDTPYNTIRAAGEVSLAAIKKRLADNRHGKRTPALKKLAVIGSAVAAEEKASPSLATKTSVLLAEKIDPSILQESLALAKAQGEVGAREIEEWVLQDVGDDGNCFYYAVTHQMQLTGHDFLSAVPEGTAPHDALRARIASLEDVAFQDRAWAEDETIDALIRLLANTMLAVVDTRRSDRGFTLYYRGTDGDIITTRGDDGEPPVPADDRPILRLAATGNHYLSVVQHPLLADGAMRAPFSLSVATENLGAPFVPAPPFLESLKPSTQAQQLLSFMNSTKSSTTSAAASSSQPAEASRPGAFLDEVRKFREQRALRKVEIGDAEKELAQNSKDTGVLGLLVKAMGSRRIGMKLDQDANEYQLHEYDVDDDWGADDNAKFGI